MSSLNLCRSRMRLTNWRCIINCLLRHKAQVRPWLRYWRRHRIKTRYLKMESSCILNISYMNKVISLHQQDLLMKLEEKENELSSEKKNALKRDKTIQGLTQVLREKEKEVSIHTYVDSFLYTHTHRYCHCTKTFSFYLHRLQSCFMRLRTETMLWPRPETQLIKLNFRSTRQGLAIKRQFIKKGKGSTLYAYCKILSRE